MKLEEVVKFINGKLDKASDIEITGIARIGEAKPGELSWISDDRYKKYFDKTKASCVVVPEGFVSTAVSEKTGQECPLCIRVKNPTLAIASLLLKFYPPIPLPLKGISKFAILGKDVKLGKGVSIGDFVTIGNNTIIGDEVVIFNGAYIDGKVKMGNHCQIHPNAVIRENVVLRNNVIVGPGAVIGNEGFAYNRTAEGHKKMPHRGGVILEDSVEIGANSTVDKSIVGNTIIKRGTKIDNLVHIAHNVEIGENCIIIAQVGIAGTVKIGDNVIIAGQAGIPDHINVGDNVVIAAQAGVTKDIPSGITVAGYPARPHMEANRAYSLMMQLPEILKRVKKLEQKLKTDIVEIVDK